MAPKLNVPTNKALIRSREPDPNTAGISKARSQKIIETVKSGSHRSIRDVALRFNLSESHLQHLFRAHTGSSLGRSLTEERLRRAADLLKQSDLSIKEIAYLTGYKHPSSFIRAFDRFFQRSPSSYRQEMLMESSSC
jgi:transcriptional regulator GlxA family with amidase domain